MYPQNIFGPFLCLESCKQTLYAHLSQIWKLARCTCFIRKVFTTKILLSRKLLLFLTYHRYNRGYNFPSGPIPPKNTLFTFTHLFVFFLYLSTDRMCEQSPDVGIETLVQRRHDQTCPKIVALYDGRIWYGWEFMGSHILQLCPSTSHLKSEQNSSSQICLAISYQSYCLINRGDRWFLKRPVEFSPPAGRVLTKHSMARSHCEEPCSWT